MLKKIAFGSVGILFLVTPLLTHATSPVMCSDGRTAPNHSDGRCPEWTDDSGTSSGGYCPNLSTTFIRGATDARTNGQVSELQRFLTDYYDINQNIIIGIFGPITQKYVMRFQREQGFPTFGIVGPMTRARIASVCGASQHVSASPTSGAAPLTVTFSVTRRPSDTSDVYYTVTFGDGADGGAAGFDRTATTTTVQHNYLQNGSYTATMYRMTGCSSWECVGERSLIAVFTITVGSTNTSIFSASPTSGAAPLSVTFTVTNNFMNGTAPLTVDFGDSGASSDRMLLKYGGVARLSHSYTSPGTYTAKLIETCGDTATCATSTWVVGTATITVTGGTTSSGAPSITGIDGPVTIGAGQTGLWTVHASVPNNADTSLRYSVIWGDEGVFDQIKAFAGPSASALQASGTFTHAYASSGTFRPTFTVTNDAGSAQTSISVVVGKDTTQLNCPQYMAPLCSASETLVAGGYGADGCQLSPRCASNTTASSGSFSASPASGDAPLTVTFTGAVNNLSFGDDGPVLIASGTSTALGTVTHVYLTSDIYTATSNGRSVNIKVNARKGTTREELFAPSSCVYNNRTYQSGTSVDVPTKTCMRGAAIYGALCEKLAMAGDPMSVTSQRYTCNNGEWKDPNGVGVEGQLVSATSCMASGGTTVANGQIIVQGIFAAAWTFDQQYNTYGKRIPTMKCSNGNWLNCDAYGNNCTQASADTNTNLANVLTAVESALKAIISLLGR